jgi:hypothetical protein
MKANGVAVLAFEVATEAFLAAGIDKVEILKG